MANSVNARPRLGRSLALAALLLGSAAALQAQVVTVPTTPQVGSSNPATAEPLVPRPSTTPCVVKLFTNMAFMDFNLKSFDYTPPADCPGPWAKVVFTADFTVTAGRQYDRTAAFYLGQANIYYGTTAEPRSTLSPSWHVERDVTDLSAIFKSPQTGEANLGNYYGIYNGVNYNGIIYANAALEFYPANFPNPAPLTPDLVIPVNGSGGDAGTLNTGTDQITQTLNLPRNVDSVYLDVIAQSQSSDEFFYTLSSPFRETEVAIDGQAAGVAPVYPWIFTGGIDPYMWEPIPGIQTLELKPYRVNLTPFAGILNDGKPHTVAVSVFNANSYFLATANLLVYLDPHARVVIGALTTDTLGAPTPVETDNLTPTIVGTRTIYTGTVDVSAARSFTISGWVNTSHGRVDTTVNQNVSFDNLKTITTTGTTYQQLTTLDSWTTTEDAIWKTTKEEHFNYPLTVSQVRGTNASGQRYSTTTISQGLQMNAVTRLFGLPIYSESVNETDDTTDSSPTPTNSTASQSYTWTNSLGGCYSRTIMASAEALTSVTDGQGCPAQ